MPGGFKHRRKPIKWSEWTFTFASILVVSLSVEFFVSASRASVRASYVGLFLFWLLWMLLPIVIFAVSALLKRQGR